MRLIAFLTAIAGLALMAFGIWGLKAPQKVGAALGGVRMQVFAVTRAATNEVREKLGGQDGQPATRPSGDSKYDPNSIPESIEDRYDKYLACQTADEECPGFSTETYYHDLVEQMAGDLQDYYTLLERDPFIIDKKDDAKLARKVLGERTPPIQIEALKILGLFPPSDENLIAITEAISNTSSKGVLSEGLNVLEKKYRGNPAYERQIADALVKLVMDGTNDDTNSNAAQRLEPFINQNTIDTFRKLRADLERRQARTGYTNDSLGELNENLRQYERDHRLRR